MHEAIKIMKVTYGSNYSNSKVLYKKRESKECV